ncbi:hypothetical protein AVEN_255837-1 [Araneus ventricosus]|uniref:Uncharacterized protein n=1 Tax=Araneus ventricosus TaxID=182803 RepID=A0A4Y2EJV2_ARAVE|nr:hypothetical protein AVEN_255837-1 [Araneus ventricosus]
MCSSVSDRKKPDDEEKQPINSDVASPSVISEKKIIISLQYQVLQLQNPLLLHLRISCHIQKHKNEKLLTEISEKRKTRIVCDAPNKIEQGARRKKRQKQENSPLKAKKALFLKQTEQTIRRNRRK